MYTSSTLDSELLRIYSRDSLFEPCERMQTRFWDDLEEADDERPGGSGLRFRIIGNMGYSVGNPAEAGDFSDHNPRTQVECFVTSAQMDSVVQISTKFLELAKDDGSYSGDAEHEAIVECTKQLFSYADILLGVGHGTGQLATVDASVVGSTTVTMALPEGAFQLRRGMVIDFANLDTGGAVQVSGVKIIDRNVRTRVITLDTAVTVTAGWGIYKSNAYGNPMPNGLRNIVDRGDFAATIFGQSRTAPNTFLNSIVLDNNGGLQDYSEELVRDLLDQVTAEQDLVPTQLRVNTGLAGEHLRVTVPDRIYTVSGGEAPKYPTGANQEKLSFTYGDQNIPFRIDRNLPARELYALHRPSWRKHTLRKADWVRAKGGPILNLQPANAGGTYAYAYIGAMLLDMNTSCRRLNAQGKLMNVRDRGSARDL